MEFVSIQSLRIIYLDLFLWYLSVPASCWRNDMETLSALSALCESGADFTNNFSITIQMWWKFHFALIQILINRSLQNLAHGTTAELSSNWIRAKWNFHRIWIVMEKCLVKWVPVFWPKDSFNKGPEILRVDDTLLLIWTSWTQSQYKDDLSKYGNFHNKYKTILLLYWEPYTGKTASLYWAVFQVSAHVTSTR